MFQLGGMEIILVLVIALLVVGPKRLPGLARDVGKGLRDFKASVEGTVVDLDAASADPPGRATAGPVSSLDDRIDDDDEILDGIIVKGPEGAPPPGGRAESAT